MALVAPHCSPLGSFATATTYLDPAVNRAPNVKAPFAAIVTVSDPLSVSVM
jgi:hypothetical protein